MIIANIKNFLKEVVCIKTNLKCKKTYETAITNYVCFVL